MRGSVVPGIRDNPRVGASAELPSEGSGPCNLTTDWGWYFRGDVEGGRVWVRRARWFVPPFDLQLPASPGTDDRYPALVREPRWERLWVAWQTGDAGVQRAHSDDDGETWSSPEMLFSGAKFPRAAVCVHTGILVYAANLGGTIVMRLQAPGDTEPRPQQSVQGFGALADEPFDVRWDYSGQRRLIFVVDTGSGIDEYVSTDPEAETITVERVN